MPSDCRLCGACCLSDSTAYIDVGERDHERLGDAADALTHVEEGRRYMRMVDERCAALEVVSGRLVCSVYERRPVACHDLLRGSPPCLAEMNLKTARARALLDR